MSLNFRPKLLVLEAREVPAAFSFQLPDGTSGHGTFATPDDVDPAQASQLIAVPDLTVVIDGVNYPVSPGATAHYAHGVLLGVIASGADTFELNLSTADVNGETATITYDGNDTQLTFQIPDGTGTTASISYNIPWGQVNWTQPNQTLPLTEFNLNVAGQNFTFGSAAYTTAPALLFSNGDIVGLVFGINTPGTPYLSIGFANGTQTVQAAAGQFINTPAPVPQMPAPKQEVTLNLNPITTGKAYIIDLTFRNGNQTNNHITTISIEVAVG
jgi:hypothetical protein